MTPYDYALLAQEAYTAKPDIGNANDASRAIVRHTPAGLVIAFPGTDNAACFVADIDIFSIPVTGAGPVHRGFWEAWTAIAEPVGAMIGDGPVTFVGHSLGAALAIMAAVSRCVAGKSVAGVYGFESPHVSPAGGIAALLASVPVYLTKNGNDMVPDLPFSWRHAGPLIRVGLAGRPWANIEDHSLSKVIAALKPAPLAVAS